MQNKSANLNESVIKPINEFKNMLSPDYVIGSIVTLSENTVALPVLRATVGYLGGGGEYGEIKLFSKEKSHPFAGGTGTIVNMNPCGFLVLNNGVVSFIKVDSDLSDKVFDKTSEFIVNTLGSKWKIL